MRFLRVGALGKEIPAALDDAGGLRDLSSLVSDIQGEDIPTLAKLTPEDLAALPLLGAELRIGACLGRVPNIVAVGLNYVGHAKETENAIPTEPLVFGLHTGSIGGPFDTIDLPAGSEKTDWEIELGVVIGSPTHCVSEADALSHVFGYCTSVDLSERDQQLRMGGQFIKGKSNPGFTPIGPWLVRADAVADPQALALSLTKDGKTMQASTTADMIFSVAQTIAYLSRFMALQPGDLIITGTPEGIGSRRSPPEFITANSVVEAEVEGLGRQTLRFRQNPTPSV